MPDFYTLWTDTGLQQVGKATDNRPFSMPTAVVGDGNNAAVIPNKGMTALVNQVWSGNVGSIIRSQTDPNTRVYEFVIPATAGPFTIREVGLEDANGNLCIIGNFPETEKPVKTSGTTRDMVIRIPVHFENADHVTLVVDPAAGASKGYVDQKVGEHADKRNNPHGVTKTQVGLGNIPNAKSDSVSSSSMNQLATSKAVKKAFDKAVAAQSTADAALPKTDQAADSARIGGVSAERVLCAGTSSWGTRAQNLDDIDKTGAYDANDKDGNVITGGPVAKPLGRWLWVFKWLQSNKEKGKSGGMIAAENDSVGSRFWLRATDWHGRGGWTQIYTHRHKPTKADVGLGNLPNAKSDAVSSTSSNQLATSKAVKTAFDKADAALPRAGGTVDGLTVFTDGISTNGTPLYSMLASVNSDYIWHNDITNEWHFCSDAKEPTKATGNSTLRAKKIGLTSDVSISASGEQIQIKNSKGDIKIGPSNPHYCHFNTDRDKFYFAKPVYVRGEIYAGDACDKRVYHQGFKPRWHDVGLDIVGSINFFDCNAPPAGWLEANGSECPANAPSLHNRLAGRHGLGPNGRSLLPDLRGEFIRGWDNGRAVDKWRGLGTRQDDQNKKHTHSLYTELADNFNSYAQHQNLAAIQTSDRNDDNRNAYRTNTNFRGVRPIIDYEGSNESRPRNVAMLVCIFAGL